MHVPLGDSYYFKFTTRDFDTGAPQTLGGTPVLSVYEENNLTQITSGITLTTNYDSVTGLNDVAIVCTTGNGYEVGKYYDVVITTGTVDGVSVVGEVVGHFRIMPAEDAGAGIPDVNTTHVSDTSQTANDNGADINTLLTRIVGTLAAGTHNAQSGDAFARLGAPAGASVSADIAVIEGQTDDIGVAGAGLSAIPWSAAWDAEVQSEVNDALVALGLDHLVSASVTGTDITDNSIIAYLVSSAATADWDTFVNTTDSLQATRDHIGDGTNLTEAGGTGDHLTAIDLPDQTMNITGNLSGSVGSVTGAVGSVTGNVGGNVVGSVGSISGVTFPTNFADLSITVTTGRVDVAAIGGTTQTANDNGADINAILIDTNSLNDTKILQTLNLTASGNIGIDWANVENPTTAVDLSATDIQLCDTVTTNTDMRGTDNALLAASAPTNFGDLSITLTTGRVDVAAIAGTAQTANDVGQDVNDILTDTADMQPKLGTPAADISADIAALNDLSAAQVNAEVVDALATDTYSEPGQGNPAATTTIAAKINYLYKWTRNQKDNDGSTTQFYADNGTTVDQKQTTSEAAGTVTKGEIVTGP